MAAVTFDDLDAEQVRIDAPGAVAFVGGLHPRPEVGRERVDVEPRRRVSDDREAPRVERELADSNLTAEGETVRRRGLTRPVKPPRNYQPPLWAWPVGLPCRVAMKGRLYVQCSGP